MIEDDDDIQAYVKPWVGLTDEERLFVLVTAPPTFMKHKDDVRETAYTFAEVVQKLTEKKQKEWRDLVTFIKGFEGFYPKAYHDQGGVITIGYGFTKSEIPGLKIGDVITREEADKVLDKSLKKYQSSNVR